MSRVVSCLHDADPCRHLLPQTAKQPPFARAYSEEHTTQAFSIRLASKVLLEPRGCTHEQAGPLGLSLDHKTSYHSQPRLSRLARTSAPIKFPCRAKHDLPVSKKETPLTLSHALASFIPPLPSPHSRGHPRWLYTTLHTA